MSAWIERMMTGTRGELLGLLRRSRRSINELAEALSISDNAVRMHVAALQRDGLVEFAGLERSTGGKPAQLFRITAAGEELFPKAYSLVLSELIGLVKEREGADVVVELLREVGARAAPRGGVDDDSREARVGRGVAGLQNLGGELDVVREPSGWVLRGHGCPLSAVVREHPEVCRLVESLVAEITLTDATECCARGERP